MLDFQMNADRKNVVFVPSGSRLEVAQEQEVKAKLNRTNEDGSIKKPTKYLEAPTEGTQCPDIPMPQGTYAVRALLYACLPFFYFC